jgi:hypothetical protein
MQHAGSTPTADVTVVWTVRHELLNSEHKSSSLAGTGQTADFGQQEPSC